MWKQLINTYGRILLLRAPPESAPYSRALFILAILLYVLVLVLQWIFAGMLRSFSLLDFLFMSLSLLAGMFVYTWLLLKIKGYPNRFVQTCTALLFIFIYIHTLALPLALMVPQVTNNSSSYLLTLLYLPVTLILSLWQLFANIHVYKFSLEIDGWQAAVIGLGLLAVNVLTLTLWH